MRTTKFSSIAIAMLMTSLCLFLTTNTNIYAITNSSIFNAGSDPRDVIQFMTSVTVVQQTQELLQVTVVRKSDESVMYQTSSSAREIYISTQGWESDDYTVHTNCEHNDYQALYFTIE